MFFGKYFYKHFFPSLVERTVRLLSFDDREDSIYHLQKLNDDLVKIGYFII